MVKFQVEVLSPDGWQPTAEQMKIFVCAGIANMVQHGGPMYRYIIDVKTIKEGKEKCSCKT